MEYKLKIIRYSHFFKVIDIKEECKYILHIFIKKYLQMGLVKNIYNKMVYSPIKVFAASDKNRTSFRFHINEFDLFIELLISKGIKIDQCLIEEIPLYTPATISPRLKDGWKPRDYQVPILEYLLDRNMNSKFVDLYTGGGKSFLAASAISQYALRTIIIVRPLFMEKWANDLVKMTTVNPKKILLIQGNKQLRGLIQIAQEPEFDYPFIILSNKTYQSFITNYENDPVGFYEDYGINPDQFFNLLKVGIKLVDEIHLDFHLNFKIEMYTHVPYTIGLSATLFHDDPFIERMYSVMYPISMRFNKVPLDIYINSYAVMYNQDYKAKISTHEFGSKKYSHIAYEKSILRNNLYTKQYFDLINYCIEIGFLEEYQKGQKLIIYVASIKMATELSNFLIRKYPEFDVRRYVEDDPYENLLDPDIRVTTILSGGVGHDIKDLTTVIMTTSIKSIQSNVQALGRLRNLNETPTKFYYLTNLDIKKQMEYHEHKKVMLTQRAKTFREVFYPNLLFHYPRN